MRPGAVPPQRALKRFLLLFLTAPLWARAEATVLVDAIPSGGAFVGLAPVGLPFRDAETADPKGISDGLSQAVAGLVAGATRQGISYICLLSSPGDNPVEAYIAPAKATLRLRRRNTFLSAVFFRGGDVSPIPLIYAFGRPDPKKPNVSGEFKKIAVPPGVTTAGWIYFNLARVQAAALKADSGIVFLEAGGSGASSPVAIPGMKEPLVVIDDHATFTAAWYTKP